MENYDALIRLLMDAAKGDLTPAGSTDKDGLIPVGISNRHIHLSQADMEALFGTGYQLTAVKELSQPGQYACKETVTVCGPKGAIEKVRVLGPVRPETQVEILQGDCFKLGISAPVKISGDLSGTPGITIVGPKGSVATKNGVMIAQRHIHMNLADAERLHVSDGDVVSIQTDSARPGIYRQVTIRANDSSSLECHLDIEEANAMGLNSTSKITICK